MDEGVSLQRVFAIIFVTWTSGCLDFNVAGMHLSGRCFQRMAFRPGNTKHQGMKYCWWTKSCTSWYVVYPIILLGFIHPRWCRILSINSIMESGTWKKLVKFPDTLPNQFVHQQLKKIPWTSRFGSRDFFDQIIVVEDGMALRKRTLRPFFSFLELKIWFHLPRYMWTIANKYE